MDYTKERQNEICDLAKQLVIALAQDKETDKVNIEWCFATAGEFYRSVDSFLARCESFKQIRGGK